MNKYELIYIIDTTVEEAVSYTHLRDAIAALCEGTNAEPVQCIGSRFVIYRAREKDPKIVLP